MPTHLDHHIDYDERRDKRRDPTDLRRIAVSPPGWLMPVMVVSSLLLLAMLLYLLIMRG